jgi:hypothetical protein
MPELRKALAFAFAALSTVALCRTATAGGDDPEPQPPVRPPCDLNAQQGVDVVARYTHGEPPVPQNHKNRHIIWIFQSATGQQAQGLSLGTPKVIAIGDFILGGPCDLLWEQDGTANGSHRLAVTAGFVQARDSDFAAGTDRPGSEWHLVGSSDLTGDGRSDVLWWNANTGALDLWVTGASGVWIKAAVSSGPNSPGWPTPPTPSSWWRAQATARLDQRRQPGIIWSSATETTGLQYTATFWTGTELVVEWTGMIDGLVSNDPVVAVGDFDGDGHPDVLRQGGNSDQLEVCYLDGQQVRGCLPTTPAGLGITNDPHSDSAVWSVVGPR